MADIYPMAWSSRTLASYLRFLGVSHVVGLIDEFGRPFLTGGIQDAMRFFTFLDESDFERVSDAVTFNGMYPDPLTAEGGYSLALFRVRSGPQLRRCDDCDLAQWKIDPTPRLDAPFEYRSEVNNPQWITSENFTIEPEVIPDSSETVPNAFLVEFFVERYPGGDQTELLLPGKKSLVELSMPPGTKIEGSVPSCVVPSTIDPTSTNSGKYCVGISEFRVTVMK
jgi:hypothetical protein